MTKPTTFMMASIQAKRLSMQHYSWYVVKVDGGWIPHAHGTDDARTQAYYVNGVLTPIQVFVVMYKAKGVDGLFNAMGSFEHFPNVTAARKAAADSNRFLKANGVDDRKHFAVECVYNRNGYHPLNENFHLA